MDFSMKNELIIAFTRKTNKRTARIFCRNFRHCCVIFPIGRDALPARPNRTAWQAVPANYILVQIGCDGVRLIPVGMRELRRMKRQGWEMLKVERGKLKVEMENFQYFNFQLSTFNFLSCVGFAKRAMGIRDPFIWTPDQLYKKIRQSRIFL
jgi:hypothetical protein